MFTVVEPKAYRGFRYSNLPIITSEEIMRPNWKLSDPYLYCNFPKLQNCLLNHL